MQKIYLGTNLKMYKGYNETISYIQQVNEIAQNLISDMQLFVIPSFLTIKESIDVVDSEKMWIGSQNMFYENEGPFTGEVSPKQLQEIGVTINELGHSERRQLFGERDDFLAEKVKASSDLNMRPLLCVGETLFEKDSWASLSTISRQVELGISKIAKDDVSRLLIAYEPVWAIGENGVPADPLYVGEIHCQIRRTLVNYFFNEGYEVPILYGGSVNLENFKDILGNQEVNGLFIGRAAWNIDNFKEIISFVDENYNQFF